jgi:RecG-like helicase
MSSITAVTLPNTPAAEQIERAKLLDEITAAEQELERLRVQEMPEREAVALSLETLAYWAKDSAHKIRTNQYRDGRACIDLPFRLTRDHQQVLVDLLAEITRRESSLTDLRSTYHDAALWEAAR